VDAQLRPLADDDLDAVAALLRAHRWADRYIDGQLGALAALTRDGDGAAIVADVDGTVAGFASLEVHRWNRLAQIHGLAVDPTYLRQGLASRLIEVLERFARESGCRGVYVDTPVDNDGAQALYRARGYREDYRMSRYYADDLDGVTFVKFFD
jgi:ribosomal protein S18 acetylase RimI-like enzyme